MAGHDSEGANGPRKWRKPSAVKMIQRKVQEGNYMLCLVLNVDPMPPSRSACPKGVDVEPHRTNDISLKCELGSGLTSFLNSHCTKTCSAVDTSLKRKRSGESHWTTDDENIIHQDRIGCGGLGDVHHVLSPRRDF